MRSNRRSTTAERTLPVCVIETLYHHTGVYRSGNQYELPLGWALREIETGRCEPVLSEYKSIALSFRGPSGPLSKVFLHYHRQFAKANPIAWLDRPLKIGEFNRVYLWFYANAPRWTKLGKYKSRQKVRENIYSMLAGNGQLERFVTLEQRFDKTLRDLRDRNAIHDFRTFLLGETHTTTGIPSDDHYDFEIKKIHRETWNFNVGVDLKLNELSLHERGRRDQYEPF